MSEAPVTPEGGNTPGGETPAATEFKPITSQDDLNQVIADRLARERAKFADYKDVKAKAAKLDELELANQTEAEKQAKRLADLEAELNSTRTNELRLKIASKFGVSTEPGEGDSPSDAELFLTGSDEETLTNQAKRLAARTAASKKSGNHVSREGHTPSSNPSEEGAFARQLFRE